MPARSIAARRKELATTGRQVAMTAVLDTRQNGTTDRPAHGGRQLLGIEIDRPGDAWLLVASQPAKRQEAWYQASIQTNAWCPEELQSAEHTLTERPLA